MRTQRAIATIAASVLLLTAPLASAATFEPKPHHVFDVNQPGPIGDIAIWVEPVPSSVSAVRGKAVIQSLDPHRLYAPAFSIVFISGDEVLRLRLINEDRKSNALLAYLRRERLEDSSDLAMTMRSRKKLAKREVRMQSVVRQGEPFDIGASWTPDGAIDLMIKAGRKEEHVTVKMAGPPTEMRVIASSGHWTILPFEMGEMRAEDPEADL
ncbi:MAG TPA: hypothetical protein VEA15_08310 [Caulobacteraceae bacterium]|nr:hypothetical protein [Caulobacteraceae bacterium]